MRVLERKLHTDVAITGAFMAALLAAALARLATGGLPEGAAGSWAVMLLVNLAFLGFFLRGPPRLSVRILAQAVYYSLMYLVLDRFVPTLGGRDHAQLLQAADEWMFGFQPARELHTWFPPAVHEVFAVGYSLFLPYLYVNLLRAILRDGPRDARRFVVGFATVYAIGYLGYVVVPAYGPRFFTDVHGNQAAFAALTQGPVLSRNLSAFMDGHSGHQCVFPSLHAAASLFVLLFEFRYRSRWIALCCLPVVAGIWIGTVYQGYHYVVDLLGALVLVAAGYTAISVDEKGVRSSSRSRSPCRAPRCSRGRGGPRASRTR